MSPSSFFLVFATLGPDGSLRWNVQFIDALATLHVETGEVTWNDAALKAGEAFKAVVGSLVEWYRTDAERFYGLNAMKVREELEVGSKGDPT